MHKRRFEDIVLDKLILLRDGAWGESVAERQCGFRMLFDIICAHTITRRHTQLKSVIESAKIGLSASSRARAEEALSHIRREFERVSPGSIRRLEKDSAPESGAYGF